MEPQYDLAHDVHHTIANIAEMIRIIDVVRHGRIAAAERMLSDLNCDVCFTSVLLRILEKAVPAEQIIDLSWELVRSELVDNYA